MQDFALEYLPYLLPALALAFGLLSGTHALLNKKDPRSALGWVVLCIFVPAIGSLAYWLIGNNRILTRARRWQQAGKFELGPHAREFDAAAVSLAQRYPERAEMFSALTTISRRVTGRPLMSGNAVHPLFNGEQAYPEMLDAIRSAKSYIYICSYLFGSAGVGRQFIDALGEAAERGVVVYVLLDSVGERYSRPRVSKVFRKYPKVKVARFLPFGLRVNLRNHRKLLVVDGDVGFTGGMNIDQRHMVEDPNNRRRTLDIHFRVQGPAVFALEHVFLEDWWFTTDAYSEPPGRSSMEAVGTALCRGIKDGPNEDFDALQMILLGAISCARKSLKIMTPYFIPSRELLAALTTAALRGVEVDIILPKKNNLPYVAWGCQAMLPEVVEYGVRVFYRPPPFSHAKILVMDEFYVNLGSSNLDPRSLKMNFEFNLEVYDAELGAGLAQHFDEVRDASTPVTQASLAARSFFVRFRDATFKLFAPYL